jgi:hypothetical protein
LSAARKVELVKSFVNDRPPTRKLKETYHPSERRKQAFLLLNPWRASVFSSPAKTTPLDESSVVLRGPQHRTMRTSSMASFKGAPVAASAPQEWPAELVRGGAGLQRIAEDAVSPIKRPGTVISHVRVSSELIFGHAGNKNLLSHFKGGQRHSTSDLGVPGILSS